MKRFLFISIMLINISFCQARQHVESINKEAALYITRGDSCMQYNDTYTSLMWYEKASQQCFNDTIIRKMANCYFKRAQYKKCLALTDTLMSDTIRYQDLKLKYNCLKRMNANDSLITTCARTIVNLNLLDASVTAELINYFNSNEYIDTALLYGERYFNIDSTNQLVNKSLAISYYIAKKYDRALNLFIGLYENGDMSISTMYYIGKIYECCKIYDKAFDYLYMAAEMSMFNNLQIVKSLSKVTLNTEHHDMAQEFIDKGIDLCQTDSLAMSELLIINAEYYSIDNKFLSNSINKKEYMRNEIKMLESSLKYCASLDAQYRISLAYKRLDDSRMEKKWLQEILNSKWEKSKSNMRIFEYTEQRLKQIKEDDFFKNGFDESAKK